MKSKCSLLSVQTQLLTAQIRPAGRAPAGRDAVDPSPGSICLPSGQGHEPGHQQICPIPC